MMFMNVFSLFIFLVLGVVAEVYAYGDDAFDENSISYDDSVYRAMKAPKLYQLAMDGDVAAMRILGQKLITGKGVKKDVRNGLKWIRKAAEEEDDPAAMYMLGEVYARGKGVTKNEKKAAEWFVKAYEEQYTKAEAKIREYPASYALDCWQAWANDNRQEAVLKLMVCYGSGSEGVKKDIQEAHSYYKKALEKWPEETKQALGRMEVAARASVVMGTADASDAAVIAFLAHSEQWDDLNLMLKNGKNINSRDKDGATALLLLAKTKNSTVEQIRFLLDNGADVKAKDHKGVGALSYAKEEYNSEVMMALVQAGAPIEYSALYTSVFYTQTDIVRQMLKQAKISRDEAVELLSLAFGTYQADMIDLILNQKIILPEELNQSYLVEKSIKDHTPDILEVLLKHGADPSGYFDFMLTAFAYGREPFGLENGEIPDIRVFMALLKTLLKAGANLNEVCSNNRPLLIMGMCAATTYKEEIERHSVIVNALLDAGVNVNVYFDIKQYTIDHDGTLRIFRKHSGNRVSALSMASFYFDEKIVKKILKRGKHSAEDVQTALHLARERRNAKHQDEIIKVLTRYHESLVARQRQEQVDSPPPSTPNIQKKAHEPESQIDKKMIFILAGGGVGLLVLIVILCKIGGKKTVQLPPHLLVHKQGGTTGRATVAIPAAGTVHHKKVASRSAATVSLHKKYTVLLTDGTTTNPLSIEELRSCYNAGVITNKCSVWTEGMPDWVPLHKILK